MVFLNFDCPVFTIFCTFQRRQEELEKRARELDRREEELRNAPSNGKNSFNEYLKKYSYHRVFFLFSATK